MRDPQNEDFLLPPSITPPRQEREGTPNRVSQAVSAVLRADRLPYDPAFGFVFGREHDSTDIVLGTEDQGISEKHFAINFNWKAKSLLLTNHSRNGFNWADPETGKIEKVMTSRVLVESKDYHISAGFVDLALRIPSRNVSEQARYDDEVQRLYEEAEKAVPTLNGLKVRQSGSDTPSVVGIVRKYVLGRVLGTGVSAIVKEAFDHETGDRFAAKEYTCTSRAIKRSMFRELELLAVLEHEHIIRYIDVIDQPTPVLIMEFADASLSDCEITTPEVLFQLMLDILAGLAYLHGKSVVHRDIKPANILLSNGDTWKLADFGLSKKLGEAGVTGTFCGSPYYHAPEMDGLPNSMYTPAIDLWSVGAVGVEYSCGFGSAKKKPRNRYHEAVFQRSKSSVLGPCLTKMLSLTPGERPSPSVAKQRLETWYSGLDPLEVEQPLPR